MQAMKGRTSQRQEDQAWKTVDDERSLVALLTRSRHIPDDDDDDDDVVGADAGPENLRGSVVETTL